MDTLSSEHRAELSTLPDVHSQLVWLLYNGTPEAVEAIIKEKGADVNHVPTNGMPPLYKAVVDNIPNPGPMIDILVKYGANVNWENSKDKKSSALYNAASKNYIRCVEALLRHKPDIDYRFNGKYTALWKAACEGFYEVVELLCIAGANKEIGGETPEDTPLFAATERGKAKAVEVLLKYGANYEATVNGHTIAYRAADFGQPEVLEVLFRHGISPDQHTAKTSSPLYVASQKGRTKVVEVLLRYKANVNYKFNVYYTPLWKAAFEGHAEIVKMLIDAGSSVNVRPPTGTPLYLAAQNGHTRVVEVLLRANAEMEVEVKGTKGLEEAAKNNHKQCVQLLLTHGARYDPPPDSMPKYDASSVHPTLLQLSYKSKPFNLMLVHQNMIYLTFNGDPSITAWNLQGQLQYQFKGHNDEITALFIHDNHLYSGSADKRLIIWDRKTGERIQTLTGHYGAITAILFHTYTKKDKANGDVSKRVLYTGSADTTVKVWDPDNGYTLQNKYSGHKGPVTCMFAKNSHIYSMTYDVLYTASVDGTIRAIDIESNSLLFVLPAQGGAITSLVEFADILYTSGADKMSTRCVNTWVESGIAQCMHVVNGLALAGFSDRNSLTSWDYKSNKINNFPGQDAPIKAMCISGNLLYSGGEDGSIKIWNLSEETLKYIPVHFNEALEISLKAPSLPTETEEERQAKLTREIFNKIEALEDQMMVMSKSIQDLYLILKRLETQFDKPKLSK